MRTRFYDTTKMGEAFDANPVLDVQREQISMVLAETRGHVSVLDLGCGAGTTSRRLVSGQARMSVVGADVSPTALAAYTETIGEPCVRLDATALPFANDAFDVVISDDVIEHLVDTDEYAREITRVLRPDGWLLLSTPNLAAWFNRLALLAGLQPAFTEVSFERVFGRPGAEIVGHLRVFTSTSTRQFLEHHGFRIVDVRGARFDAITGAGRMVDRVMARFPTVAGNTAVLARPGGSRP